MNNTETSNNSSSKNVTVQNCPSQFFSIRELRGYLRSRCIPNELLEHLNLCSVCDSNWNFLNETDVLLARYREQRFGLVLKGVQAEAQGTILSQSMALRMRGDSSALDRRKQLMNDIKEVLARALKIPEQEVIAQVREGSLDAEKIVEVCQNIGAITDSARRAQQATKIAGLFQYRIEQKGNSELIGSLLSSPEATIDLRRLGADLETSVAFVASIPHTSFVTPPILEMGEDGEVLFHASRLKQALQQYGRGLLANH
jgi:hypothetical protein